MFPTKKKLVWISFDSTIRKTSKFVKIDPQKKIILKLVRLFCHI